MKIYIYKLLIAVFFFYVLFELTIGTRIDYYTNKINFFSDEQSRNELKEKIKSEIKKGIEKENLFTDEEKVLISDFINKVNKELNLKNK
jgi:hypothetical protein